MKRHSGFALAAALVLLITSSSAFADNISTLTLGKNITVFDTFAVAGYNGRAASQGAEDNETEGTPNTYQSQDWDLEGIFQNGNSLAIVGGFKFDTGVQHGSIWYTSGDLFIDVTGPGSTTLWDYAIRMNFDTVHHTQTYDVYQLNNSTTFQLPSDVLLSTPWKVDSNYSVLASGLSFNFDTTSDSGFSGWTAPDPGPDGDPYWVTGSDIYYGTNTHYVVRGFNTDFLGGAAFNTHFTMKCGNDLLLGQSAVPEPVSLVLLGLGLAGLGVKTYKRKSS